MSSSWNMKYPAATRSPQLSKHGKQRVVTRGELCFLPIFHRSIGVQGLEGLVQLVVKDAHLNFTLHCHDQSVFIVIELCIWHETIKLLVLVISESPTLVLEVRIFSANVLDGQNFSVLEKVWLKEIVWKC